MYDPGLSVLVTEEQWGEARHELDRRLRQFIEHARVPAEQIALVPHEVQVLIDRNVIEVVPRHVYGHLEAIARRRIPRDPNDWPTVALALALNADILTHDHDFLSCGCATWTVETLRGELSQG